MEKENDGPRRRTVCGVFSYRRNRGGTRVITSNSNASVREVIQLNQKAKARNASGLFVAEGVRMFEEVPADRIVKVYIARRAERELGEIYGDRLEKLSVEIVADDVFDRMCDTKTPQGILCLVRQFAYGAQALLETAEQGGAPLFLLLEDLQDPGNLGTIFRTGEAAGASGILMSRGTVDVYNPKVIRATMGSVCRVPFLYTEDLQGTIRALQDGGVSVYAAHLDGEEDYDAFDYRPGCAFLIGNEGGGLRAETAACADRLLKIPMAGKVESLNAAVAASLLMYEAARQRRSG